MHLAKLVRSDGYDLLCPAILQRYNLLPDDEPSCLVRRADKMYAASVATAQFEEPYDTQVCYDFLCD